MLSRLWVLDAHLHRVMSPLCCLLYRYYFAQDAAHVLVRQRQQRVRPRAAVARGPGHGDVLRRPRAASVSRRRFYTVRTTTRRRRKKIKNHTHSESKNRTNENRGHTGISRRPYTTRHKKHEHRHNKANKLVGSHSKKLGSNALQASPFSLPYSVASSLLFYFFLYFFLERSFIPPSFPRYEESASTLPCKRVERISSATRLHNVQ